MSEFRKAHGGNLYFVTLTVTGWVDVFSRSMYKDIIVNNLQYCQEKENLEIYAYVIMTNHIHLVARRDSEDSLTELLGRFKGFTSKKILTAIKDNTEESRKEWLLYMFKYFASANKQYSNYHFWQYTNAPVELWTLEVIMQKIEYIHMNPVRAGIVTNPESYLYSSACPDSPLRVLQLW